METERPASRSRWDVETSAISVRSAISVCLRLHRGSGTTVTMHSLRGMCRREIIPNSPPVSPLKSHRCGRKRAQNERRICEPLQTGWRRNAGPAADLYVVAISNVEWLKERQNLIHAARDEPKALEELQAGVGKRRPGYDDHHIAQQTWAEYFGFTRSQIDDPSNRVSIRRLKQELG